MNTIFNVFWYDSTWGMNLRSTDCKADALTTSFTLCTAYRVCLGIRQLLQFKFLTKRSTNALRIV